MTDVPTPVSQTLRLANETNRMAAETGRPELRTMLADQAARWKDDAVTVVVAGAQKRGKSRLLNVLIGQPGLLPVDADIATNTHVTISFGPSVEATALVSEQDGRVERHPIDPGELEAYASVLGDPARRAGVVGVELTTPEPSLQGIRLVDTPGVDSLTLGHRHATTAALARADVLLFAVSAQDQPILRHELEFLAEAAERVHTIGFVLTKVDDSAHYQELLAANRTRLVEFLEQAERDGRPPEIGHRLRQAPWYPVSAALAEAARELAARGRTERAETRAASSGIPRLRAFLQDCSERRQVVRAAGVVTLTTSVLRLMEAANRDATVAGTQGAATVEERAAEIDTALGALAEREQTRKRNGIDKAFLGQEVSNRARQRLDGYLRQYRDEIDEIATTRAMEAYVQELPSSLERSLAAAWDEIASDARSMATEVLDAYLHALGMPPVPLDPDALSHEAGPVADRLRATRDPRSFDYVGEGLPMVMMAGSVGFMAANVGFIAAAGPLAPVAIGVTLAGLLIQHRRKIAAVARTRNALTAGVADVFKGATAEMTTAVQMAVTTWRGEAEEMVDRTIADERRELTARRKNLEKVAATSTAERARLVEEAEERAGRIEGLLARADALRAVLGADVGSATIEAAPAGRHDRPSPAIGAAPAAG